MPLLFSLVSIAITVDMKPGRHLHVVEGSDSSAAVSHDWPAQTNGFGKRNERFMRILV